MTDKEKLDAIRAEIHRLVDVKGYDRGMAIDLFAFMDLLPNEPVSNELEEAAWTYYDKNKPLIPHELDLHKEMISFFIAGAQWQKENLWKPADGEDLPEIDKEVIALIQPCSNDEHLRVVFAHRPNKYTTWIERFGEKKIVEVERYGKGEWNIPNVKWWLDCELPKIGE